MHKNLKKRIVYKNKWIKILSKKIKFKYIKENYYYSIIQKDYVWIIVKTDNNLFPLVKQYRHSIEKYTLEFPSGTLEKKETPKECAIKEVKEETGLTVTKIIKMGVLYPDSGRLGNKAHMYYAECSNENIAPIDKKEGIKVHYYSKKDIKELIKNNKILQQPHVGLFYTAIIQKLI